ncbi:MAG: hypothetical protein QM726_10735 [Chitinophagaceae bacterium]
MGLHRRRPQPLCGNSFTNYGLSEGLPGSNVLGAFMDNQQRLWVYTPIGIATLFNNRFTSYPFADALAMNCIYSITQMRDGRLLALTSAGIYVLRGKTCRWLFLSRPHRPI